MRLARKRSTVLCCLGKRNELTPDEISETSFAASGRFTNEAGPRKSPNELSTLAKAVHTLDIDFAAHLPNYRQHNDETMTT